VGHFVQGDIKKGVVVVRDPLDKKFHREMLKYSDPLFSKLHPVQHLIPSGLDLLNVPYLVATKVDIPLSEKSESNFSIRYVEDPINIGQYTRGVSGINFLDKHQLELSL
jgi:hypothetical protein